MTQTSKRFSALKRAPWFDSGRMNMGNAGANRIATTMHTPPVQHACGLDWLLLRTWEDDGGGLLETDAADTRRVA